MASEEVRQNMRTQLAQEVLELGEELFELVRWQPGKAVDNQASIEIEEMSKAKEEFFTALRLLLGGTNEGAMP